MNRLLLFLGYYLFCFPLFSQKALQFFPEKPMPGEKITLKYNTAQSPFDKVEDLVLIAYFKENGKLKAEDVQLHKQGQDYVATIHTTEQTKVLLLGVNHENLQNHPGNQTYHLLMYNNNKEPIQGAYYNLGYIYYYEATQLGLERDIEKGQMLMEKEFALHPEAKLDPDYMGSYASVILREQDENAVAVLQELAGNWSKNKAGERKMTYAYQFLQKLGDKDAAQKLRKKILRKYPQGILIKEEIVSDFWETRDNFDAAEKAYARFERLIDPAAKDDVKALSDMATRLATAYGESGNWEKFDKYANTSASGLDIANTFNSIAWGIARQNLPSGKKNLHQALELSERSLQLIESALESPLTGKPDIWTTRQWLERIQHLYGMFSDTYALIRYQMNDYETALKYQEIALEKSPPQSPDFYERYAYCVEKIRGGKAAETLLADLIQKGVYTSSMKAQYRRLFLENNTLESAFEMHLALLEQKAGQGLREKLAQKMLNLPAPDFKLINLNGEEVRLSELKEKVVVLDFWATWCMPCIASFPAMKNMVDNYRNDDQVVFLFVNSWENMPDKEKAVARFLKDNGYEHFNVPMDTDDEVIEAFQVEGLPTQFIIGPKGMIRFKKLGFNGKDDEQIKKLQLMIELARGV